MYNQCCNTLCKHKSFLLDDYKLHPVKEFGPGGWLTATKFIEEAPGNWDEEEIKLSLTGLWFRMNDKIQRLKQLVVLGKQDNIGESCEDTFQDLSVYGIIAQLVSSGKWAK